MGFQFELLGILNSNNVQSLNDNNSFLTFNIDPFHKFRLDQILGRQGSKAKDVYESKLSLASRIVKTERQVLFTHPCHTHVNIGLT